MSVQSTEAPTRPSPLTYRQLIHQDDKIIKNYAFHYHISTDLTRGQILEEIYKAHPGPDPLPLLEHDIAQKSTPSGAEPLPAAVPAQIVEKNETQGPPNTPPDQDQDPDPFEYYPRFPTPSDAYSPKPSPPRSPGGGYMSTGSSPPPLPKPRMEFVYPPVPRAHKRPHDEVVDEVPRGFSPGPCWLEKMYCDLEKGRREVSNDLEEAKKELREALEDVKRADVALKHEANAMKEFLDWVRKVAGEEMVARVIEETARRVEGGVTEDEDTDSEIDGDESESDGPEDDGNGNGSGRQAGPISPKHPPHGPSTGSSAAAPGSENGIAVTTPPQQDSDEINPENGGSKKKSPGVPSMSRGLPPLDELTDEELEPGIPIEAFGFTVSMLFGDHALPREEIHRRIGIYLDAHKDDPKPPTTKRAKHSHSPPLPRPTANGARGHSVPPIASFPTRGPSQPVASSSRKRGRGEDQSDDGEGGSELEVERSVRYSEGEENDGGNRAAKRRRSDGAHDDLSDSSVDGDSPGSSDMSSPPARQFRRTPFSGFFGSDASESSSSSTSDDDDERREGGESLATIVWMDYEAPNSEEDMDDDDFDELDLVDEGPDAYEFDVDDDQMDYDGEDEVPMRLYYTREGPRSGSWTHERTEIIPPPYYGVPYPSLPPSSQPQPSSEVSFDFRDGLTGPFTEPSFEFISELPVFSPEPAEGASEPIAGPSFQPIPGSSSQPEAGPSNPVRRPLTRARERIRETASGTLEEYTYDTGSEYEEREERREEQLKEWRRLRMLTDGYPFNVEFLQMRGRQEELLSFAETPALDPEEEEEESQVPKKKSKKGKGKKRTT